MKHIISILFISFFFVSCAPSTDQIQKAVESTLVARGESTGKAITNTPLPTNTSTITNTPQPSNTPKPTHTPTQTNTPAPTDTPVPTNTMTPVPQPINFSGNSDQVIDFENHFGPSFAHISYQGGGNFAVWNLDNQNENIDLLVNVVGNYDGYVPIDFLDNEKTSRLKINASGQWEIVIYPLAEQNLRLCEVPGTCEGKGDDVRAFKGSHPDTAQVSHSGKSNFAVWSYGGEGRDLLINDIGNYNGTVLFGKDVFLVVIKADGEWKFDITGR